MGDFVFCHPLSDYIKESGSVPTPTTYDGHDSSTYCHADTWCAAKIDLPVDAGNNVNAMADGVITSYSVDSSGYPILIERVTKCGLYDESAGTTTKVSGNYSSENNSETFDMGTEYYLYIRYIHVKDPKVSEGSTVSAGQVIALTGGKGGDTHLHVDMSFAEKTVNDDKKLDGASLMMPRICGLSYSNDGSIKTSGSNPTKIVNDYGTCYPYALFSQEPITAGDSNYNVSTGPFTYDISYDNAVIIGKCLIDRGASLNLAIGILANVWVESGFGSQAANTTHKSLANAIANGDEDVYNVSWWIDKNNGSTDSSILGKDLYNCIKKAYGSDNDPGGFGLFQFTSEDNKKEIFNQAINGSGRIDYVSAQVDTMIVVWNSKNNKNYWDEAISNSGYSGDFNTTTANEAGKHFENTYEVSAAGWTSTRSNHITDLYNQGVVQQLEAYIG